MRKITTSALLFLLLFKLHAQPINNIRVTLPRQLPANTAEWASLPQPIIISAQAKPVQGRIPPEVMESRVVVTIENSAGKSCGAHNQSNAPMSNFTSAVKTWTGAQAVGLLGQECTLRSGEYQFCVEFYGTNMATGAIAAISEKKCFPFTITGNEEYSPPTLINPENGKQYTEAELMRPVTFRWTPLVPKPKDPVTYRLRVWQLMQGQNSTSAMRSSEPIITKDISNVTQAVVNAVLTGPCKPPYLCEFVWNVQALSRDGKPVGNNNGTSEPYQFKATTANTETNPPALTAPANNSALNLNDAMRSIRFQWTAVNPKPQDPVTYRLRVWQLMQGQNGTSAMRSNQPIVTKEVFNATEVTVNAILTGPCRPPYLCEFIWQVQAVTREGKPVGSNNGTSEPSQFTIADGITITPPALISPANESRVKLNDAKRSIKFTWTGVNPKQNEPVVYRLRVWQLMQGQNGTSAMRSNKPIVTKEVTDATEVTVNGILTGPCRPPYLCEFIWEVQAVTRSGKTLGSNNGTSETWAFKILDDNINTKIDSVKVGCCENGKQSIYIKIRNLHISNQAQVTSIKYRVNGTGPLTTLTPTAPPLAFTIPANGAQAFTGSINCVDSMQTIKFIVETVWPTDPDNINTETALDTLKCACNFCSETNFKLNMPPPVISISGNAISFSQNYTLTTTPAKPIKSITAELVYFEMIPENDLCVPCNKDDQTYGHFSGGINSQVWNDPVPASLPIKINIPPLTPCCKAKFRWCIRYKIEFKDCTSCNKLVCYEKEKAGCDHQNDNPTK